MNTIFGSTDKIIINKELDIDNVKTTKDTWELVLKILPQKQAESE